MARTSTRSRYGFGIWMTALSIGLLVVPGLVSAGERVCTSAEIDEPFVLPDGSEHPGGRLTLCLTRNYTPVAALHETYVEGMPVGMLMSRRGISESSSTRRPYMMFGRGATGRLAFVGYANPSAKGMQTYTLKSVSWLQPSALVDEGAPIVLIAARTE